MHTWTIGSATVTRVEEHLGITGMPCEKYLGDFERDVLERHLGWLAPDHYSPQHDRFVTSVHSWLIRRDNLTILIDTCGGNHKERPFSPRFHQQNTPYLDVCARPARPPKTSTSCSARICTPIMWAGTPCCATAAGFRPFRTPSICSRGPTTPIGTCGKTRRSPAIRVTRPMTTVSCRSCSPARPCWSTMATTSQAELSVEAAPGHTPGHVVFRLADEGRRAVFCGDVIHHALQVYAPHWNHMHDERPADAAVSRRRLLESCAEQGSLLFPIHFGAPHVCAIEGRRIRQGSCKATDHPRLGLRRADAAAARSAPPRLRRREGGVDACFACLRPNRPADRK